ncbi:MAG TPA: HD domain-containing phosphohydrolase [Longimicrobiales bacterium]|nr:HD domain-containing phosphohydrolase [Longimicrobiales bacterium]
MDAHLPERRQVCRVEFLTRERGVLEASIVPADGLALAPYIGSRHGSITVTHARWASTGEHVDELTLRLGEVIWARALRPCVAVADERPGEHDSIAVEVVLAGDVELRGRFPVSPGHSISEYLGTMDTFPVLWSARAVPDGRYLGDIVLNPGALHSVRAVHTATARAVPVARDGGEHFGSGAFAGAEVAEALQPGSSGTQPFDATSAGDAAGSARFEARSVPPQPFEAAPFEARPSEARPFEVATRADAGVPPAAAVRGTGGSVVDLLVGMLEFRDPFFRGSSSLTRLLSVEIGRELGLDNDALDALGQAALLRDLGRVVEDGLLGRKIEVVDDDEVRRRGRGQIALTLSLLQGLDIADATRETIQFHHERFDGTGYPEGLRGDDIPLPARILAVAECYAAVIAPRPHRPPRRMEAAMAELHANAGRQLDPVVLFALQRVLEAGEPRALRFGLRNHVLIVQPDHHEATTLAVRLCSHGFLGESVADLATAQERLRRVPVEALVVSTRNGTDRTRTFIEELRASRSFAALPVVVVDADTSADRAAFLDAGADLCFPADACFEEIRAALGSLFGRTAVKRGGSEAATERYAPWETLQGSLEDFGMSWLLQMLRYDSRTACVFVRTSKDAGAVYLEGGEPRHAVTGALRGRAALSSILRWRQGDFVVQPEVGPPEHTIEGGSLIQLLLEDAVEEDFARVTFGAVS